MIARANEHIQSHYPLAVRVAGELLGRPEFPTTQAQMVKLVVEHKDGKPREQVDMRVSGELGLTARVQAARRRLAEDSQKG